MANFESGVSGYVKAKATVEVHFPIDWRGSAEVACKHCDFFRRTSMRCGLNQSMVNFPDKYVGDECPLVEFESEEKK